MWGFVTRTAVALIMIGATLLTSGSAYAYGATFTHRWIMRVAAQHLARSNPAVYGEVADHVDALAEGVFHEDDSVLDGDGDPLTFRVMRHFYRPVDGLGLFMMDQQFPSSFLWATTPDNSNQWQWEDALEHYRRGDLDAAYFTVAHVIHLIQDATVPAHTHLDAHPPPHGDNYEAYCSTQMLDEYRSSLPAPAPGASIPTFASLDEAWFLTASISYHRNRYSGSLSVLEGASGEIAEMFPKIRWSWFSEKWWIDEPEVGALGEAFFELEPGWFYFKITGKPAAHDRVPYDPMFEDPSGLQANPAEDPMAALMARELVPIAILHSAGVLKMFVDEARALAPIQAPELDPPVPPHPGGCAGGASRPAAALGGGWILAWIGRSARRRRRACP